MSYESCLKEAKSRYKIGDITRLQVSFVCLRQAELKKERKIDHSSAMRIANEEFNEYYTKPEIDKLIFG